MTTTELIHHAIFFAWIPLGVMVLDSRSDANVTRRLTLLTAFSFLLCVYIFLEEFVTLKRVTAPIRVDLLFLIPLFSGLCLATGIWGIKRWWMQRSVALLVSSGLILLMSAPSLLLFANSMWSSGQNIAKMRSIPLLIFDAQFKNAENFTKTFGSIDSSKNPVAGHYQSDNGSWATRLIINTDGHLWLYFLCNSKTECVRAQADIETSMKALPPSLILKPQIGDAEEGQLSNIEADRFTLSLWTQLNGRRRLYMNPVTFVRSPVPFHGALAGNSEIKYLGAFAQAKVRANYVEPIQLWLWQAGPKFLAYYVRSTLACGIEQDFISPTVLEGEAEGAEIHLANAQSTEGIDIKSISEHGIDAEVIYNGQPFEALNLKPHTIFKTDRFEIAPLTTYKETKRWLETVSMGYSFKWRAECTSL